MSSLRQLFLHHVAQTSDAPVLLEIEKGEGIYLYDPSGKKYMDMISGIGVSSLGHCHPAVIEAVKKQADKYLHTMVYGEFVMSPQVQLAKLLSDNLPASLDCVYFANSGSEAIEGAMKLIKKYTGRREIIACRNAYHGSTQGADSLMSPKIFTQAFHPLLPGIRHINFNMEEDLEKITTKTAGVIVETVQGEAGVQIPKNDYLKKLRKRCDETGTLLVLDEIQAGFGRTGTLWAFEQYGIIPDIITIAKGMGGGMPIAAFIASKQVMQVLSFNPVLGHINTFGGHPVSCAASLATLKTLLKEHYISTVKEKEKLFKALLIHPAIKEIRSAGLWMAIDFGDFDTMFAICNKCIENGVITDWFLFNETSIRIAPPLIISEEEIRMACDIILKSIDTVVSKI